MNETTISRDVVDLPDVIDILRNPVLKELKRGTIKDLFEKMEVGEILSYPLSRMKTIRTTASELGLLLGRKFRTKVDRENYKIHVIRDN